MENRAHALMAGLFMLLLGTAVIGSLWWFGGKREATSEYVVVTKKNVTGLSMQAQVRYRGIRVGKVERIDLDPKNARQTLIRIRIRQEIPVTKATTAKLGFQGVTGIAHVLLEDSGANSLPLEGVVGDLPRIAMQDSLMDELSDVGGDTLRQAREFLNNANQLFNSENRQKISHILSNLDATTSQFQTASDHLNQLLSPENVQLLHSTLVRAEHSVGQVGPFISDARGLIVRLNSASEKLESSLGHLSDVALNTEASLATLAPRVGELMSGLSSNSRQLNQVLNMLEESPQALLFGRDLPAPGPGEAGFVVPLEATR